MKCPLSVPWNLPFPSMTVSTINHENIIPWDRRPEPLCCSPLQTDVRTFPSSQSHGRLLAQSYSSCTSAEGESFQQKLEGDLILLPPACKASSAFVPLQMTPRWVDLIIHTCMPVHNASKIPGLWQHLTWAAHSNRAYQQALGKRPCRRRENPCSGVLLI